MQFDPGVKFFSPNHPTSDELVPGLNFSSNCFNGKTELADSSADFSKDLPMISALSDFAQLVMDNDVVILHAETGAGKSTQGPAHLLKFFDRIICTQPRRLAALNIGHRVSQELGVELGTVVGVRTAQVQESTHETKLLFCTDGWAAQYLMSSASKISAPHSWWHKGKPDVLIIDEAHEQNLAQEVLLAHWRQQYICWQADRISGQEKVPHPPKLVMMSATLGIDKLQDFFKECGVGGSLGVLSVPGRQYPIEDIYNPNLFIPEEVKFRSDKGLEGLIFDKGKKEISDLIEAIHTQSPNSEVLPLYRDLPSVRQDACFEQYSRPRTIVSTNIAESSLTPDVDYVVSTGDMKVLIPYRGGYCLAIVECPQFNLKQQRGRAGRTKPGTWILAGGRPFDERPEMLSPEILRSPLEGTALNLIKGGFAPSSLVFLNEGKSTKQRLNTAIENLKSFGYLKLKDGRLNLTEKGTQFRSYPVRFELNVFLNELQEMSNKEEFRNPALAKDLVRWGLIIAAVIEVGRIHKRCGDNPINEPWYLFGELANIANNDVFAHTKLFLKTHNLFTSTRSRYDVSVSDQREIFEDSVREKFESLHLEMKKYQQVIDMLDLLTKGDFSKFMPIPDSIPENGTQSRVLDCLIKAFKHELYSITYEDKPSTKKSNGKYYSKPKSSMLVRRIDSRDASDPIEIVKSALIKEPSPNEIILGLPFNLEKEDGQIVHLLQFPVVVSKPRVKGIFENIAL